MSAIEKKTLLIVLVTIIGVLVAFIMVFPIVWLLMSSSKDSIELFAYPLHFLSKKFSLDSYASVIRNGFSQHMKNSLFLAVVDTLITLVISSMCGYALATYRHEIPYMNKVSAVFLLGALIPGGILAISQFTVISGIGLHDNIWGIMFPVVMATADIFMYRQHFMTIPLSLTESARLDGAGEFKIFTPIMMPLVSSIMVPLTILSLVQGWNDYILSLMVLSDQKKFTIQTTIKSYIGTTGVNWNTILTSSILSILPIIIIFIFLQKCITGGIATTDMKR